MVNVGGKLSTDDMLASVQSIAPHVQQRQVAVEEHVSGGVVGNEAALDADHTASSDDDVGGNLATRMQAL